MISTEQNRFFVSAVDRFLLAKLLPVRRPRSTECSRVLRWSFGGVAYLHDTAPATEPRDPNHREPGPRPGHPEAASYIHSQAPPDTVRHAQLRDLP